MADVIYFFIAVRPTSIDGRFPTSSLLHEEPIRRVVDAHGLYAQAHDCVPEVEVRLLASGQANRCAGTRAASKMVEPTGRGH